MHNKTVNLDITSSISYFYNYLQIDFHIYQLTRSGAVIPIDCMISEDLASRRCFAFNMPSKLIRIPFDLSECCSLILSWNIYQEWKRNHCLFDISVKSIIEEYQFDSIDPDKKNISIESEISSESPYFTDTESLPKPFYLSGCMELYDDLNIEWPTEQDYLFFKQKIQPFDFINKDEVISIFGDLSADIQRFIAYRCISL